MTILEFFRSLFRLWGVGSCKRKNPQAEACATSARNSGIIIEGDFPSQFFLICRALLCGRVLGGSFD
jgi:hypothetical protein